MAKKKSSCVGCLAKSVMVGMLFFVGLAILTSVAQQFRLASMTPEELAQYERQQEEQELQRQRDQAAYDEDRKKHQDAMDEKWREIRQDSDEYFAEQQRRDAEREAAEKPKQDLEWKTGQRRRADLRACFDNPSTVTADWYPNTWHLKSGGITYKGTVTAKSAFNVEVEHDYHLRYDSDAELVYLSIGDHVWVNETDLDQQDDRETKTESRMSAYEREQARKRAAYLKEKEDRKRKADR